MTKEESQILKGVAILLMIFLHLFNREGNVDLCTHFLYVADMPFVFWLHYATNPVSFFLVLSGVGMYKIYKRGKDVNRLKRIKKIYSHLWLTLMVFTFIGCCFFDRNYYSDTKSVIYNYFAIKCTWNAEIWFLFPYLCLMFLSPYIFKLTDKLSIKLNVFLFGSLYVFTSFIISRFGDEYLYNNMLIYNPFLVLHLMPAFVFGGLICRSSIKEHLMSYLSGLGIGKGRLTALSLIGILCAVIGVCAIRTSVVYPFYAAIFIILFSLMPRLSAIDTVLCFIGKHSMNIWFTHTWYCYYLFHDSIYSLSYPLLIFLVVLLLSVLSSIVIEYIMDALSVVRKRSAFILKQIIS